MNENTSVSRKEDKSSLEIKEFYLKDKKYT
jgi:hypothetical protein